MASSLAPPPIAARAYVYVLPCITEDLLKLGFSRNPLSRMQALHPRFYEFFDLDRAYALHAETIRDARALELTLRRALQAHNAPAPLTAIRAAGVTEWYRGAWSALDAASQALQSRGHIRVGLRGVVQEGLQAARDQLYTWASLLTPDEAGARGSLAHATLAQRRVRDVLDAYRAVGLDPESSLPDPVRDWYRASRGEG